MPPSSLAICLVSALAVGGVILRPFALPEWIFAVAGAACLVVFGLLSPGEAATGIATGLDVYLFLTGMMLLAEIARREGLFDYLAVFAARAAKGSPNRLFALTYLIGTLVTVFLSNDATAVVLTPAVAAVARAARARSAVPYLLICAFVANAASFVLPISNPANLVIFGQDMPPLGEWLSRFGLASALSIGATYVMLWLTQRRNLTGPLQTDLMVPHLSVGGRIAAAGIVLAALVLIAASALGFDLGWPTAIAGFATLAIVSFGEGSNPWSTLKGVAWDTLLLVAGLFVIVAALEASGLKALIGEQLLALAEAGTNQAVLVTGTALAVGTNLTNNLPLGLVAGGVLASVTLPQKVADAVLIGIDLGPNLSVTGSLATILWLTALKREGIRFGALSFLKIGSLVMAPALLLSLGAVLLLP